MVDADGPGFVGALLVLVVMYVLGVYLDCYLGKHTVDTLDDFNVWTEIFEEENWDPDSESLDQILGDNLALAVGTLEWDLPHMRRNLGGAHPDVLAFEEILLQARDVLRAREASRLGF